MDKNISIKVEDLNNQNEECIEENIIMNENAEEILAINNNSNIQLEFINVKNISQDGVEFLKDSENLVIENENLKKELTSTQEKFAILQSQVQHQAKLIELLLRLDMVKAVEEPDKREMDDLQRKIQLCFNLIDECNIKFSELSNERRRVLIVSDNEPAPSKVEKRAAIWNHFTVLADTDGEKSVECNYCGKCFAYRNMNASKCREHINEKCDKAPDEIKSSKPRRYNSPPTGSKYTVWNYFINSEKDGKISINCIFCGIEYSSKNATKCREHLAFKCRKIDEEVRIEMRSTFSQDYIDSYNKQKRSTIWEHFCIINDDDKTVIQCIYCCMNYANKNATKCREHLLERCDKIPLSIRHKINNSFYESPLKTWTQIKIPIWKHFSLVSHQDRRQYQCNYCKKIYSSKNVTKFRLHLLYKCEQIPDDVKSYITMEMTRSSLKSCTNNEDGDYYEDESHHFLKEEDDDDDEEEDEDDEDYPTGLCTIATEQSQNNINDIDDNNEHHSNNSEHDNDNDYDDNDGKEGIANHTRSSRFKRRKMN
ncbi:uncharacterized protein LOC113792843 [Dermatophagoides pteronyssinus]|uniref:Uncharacterized protein LOC113792843 n=1 Tax=Dermatophagoides pteronyssinus TaxID=6956 RepID=A0A6P6Y0H4_DERPT|nr:uncharacterized protein LOC113792843 [Dermatophagoides pteronyssinus]